MTNLQLPKMTRDNIANIWKSDTKEIAYKTKAIRIWNDGEAEYNYLITHHDNHIAQLGHDITWLSNGGWNSKTTAHRLHRICIDNEMPFAVAIRNYDMVLMRRVNDTFDYVASFSHHDFLFRRTETSWIIER